MSRQYSQFNNLKKYMELRGVDVRWMCNKCKIRKSTMYRYINNESLPNVADAKVMADALNLTLDDLYGRPFDAYY